VTAVPEVVTRTREARRRAAEYLKELPAKPGPAGMWSIAALKMQALQAEQTAALAEAVEAVRDILLEMRASTPLR
jgi:hypothetical protein